MGAITFTDIARCPLRPSGQEIRTAAASVLNMDGTDTFTEHEAVIVLAYKLLSDVGIDQEYTVTILRYFRAVLLHWNYPQALLLSVNDNRYAVLVGPHDAGGVDYKAGLAVDPTKLPAPLLQASVNLAGLYELIA